MKILFLSRWFPYPPNNGSKLRIYNLLRGLSQHHDLTLLSFIDQPGVNPEVPEIRSLCSNIYVVPWKEFKPRGLVATLGFLSLKPRSIIDTFSAEMAHKITELLKGKEYDLVIASQLAMAAYCPYFNSVPALFEEIEVGLCYESYSRAPEWPKKLRHAFTWFKFRAYLSRLLKSFRAATVVSQRERALVLEHFPIVEKILVVPNCMNLSDYRDVQAAPIPNRLVFTGSFRYYTNYEAMRWFVGEVFPLVLEKIPDAQLIITGDHANLPLPSDKNVTLAGYVDDIKNLIASSTVAIAPLWSGGGTRVKILEAMAIGTPVIATSKGAEGLDAQSSEHLFIADDPVHFADCVIRLLLDEDLRRSMARKANLLVQENYAWGRTLPDFVGFVESIVEKRNCSESTVI